MKKILIAYATKTGSTKEVAIEIGHILEENGFIADVKSINDVKTFEEYSGAIIGAPINGMKWLPEAEKFILDNENSLKNLPTAYFLLSYMLIDGRKFWVNVIKKSLDPSKTKINPVMVGMFGGRIETQLPAILRFVFGIKKNSPLDKINWDEVKRWANELATKLNV